MCLLNCITKKNKYKHITKQEREMIDRWFNKEKKSKKEIANLLNKSERTIQREIKRGLVEIVDYSYKPKYVYSSSIAQEKYDYNKTDKGQNLKIGNNLETVLQIEEMIIKERKSPEVISKELNLKISARTIRNYIAYGTVFNNIEKGRIIYNKKTRKDKQEKRVSKMIPAEKSIEHRPKEVENRAIYGHWEGDLIVGKKGTKTCLLTLFERQTREAIIVKVKNKQAETIATAFDDLEKKYKNRFKKKFKTITFDNGVEFQNYKLLEKSIYNNENRFTIYYAHPYCSFERGTNENGNRMIRRFILKGQDIKKYTKKFIREVTDWLNNYLRPMFEYKSSNMLKLELGINY